MSRVPSGRGHEAKNEGCLRSFSGGEINVYLIVISSVSVGDFAGLEPIAHRPALGAGTAIPRPL